MKVKRRVVHVISGLATGGAERDLARLAPHLAERGFAQEVLVLGPLGPPAVQLEAAGIPVIALRDRWGPLSLPIAVTHLIEQRYELIHAWLYRACALSSCAVLRPGAPPLVWTILQSLTEIGRERLLHRVSLGATFPLSRMASAITYNSHLSRQQHEKRGYPGALGRVIPNGFDTVRFAPADSAVRETARAQWGISPGEVVIGIAARLHPLKDFPTFFAAAAILAARRPEVRFMAMGTGLHETNPAVQALAAQVPAGRILLAGERRDPERIMAVWDIATLCSVGEALPNAIGEAMACGLPVAATDVGDCARLVGDAGLIVPPSDPVALAAAWERLVDIGIGGRRRLGGLGRTRITESYSLASMVDGYAGMYGSLMR